MTLSICIHLSKIALIAAFLPLAAQAGQSLKFIKGDIQLSERQVLTANEADDQIWIVQFKSKITAADQTILQANGGQIYRYIPEDALVVRGSKSLIEKNLSNKLQGLMPYRGDFKLGVNLPVFSVMMSGQRDVLSLTVINEAEVAATLSALQRIDSSARILQQSGRFFDITMDLSKVPRLAAVAGVEFIEAKAEVIPLHMTFEDQQVGAMGTGDYSDLTGFETGTKLMNFDAAYSAGFAGEGQIVAMADTGVDMGSAATMSTDFQGAIYKGYSMGVGAKDWDDPMGHGTHVAGSVLGRGAVSGGALHGGAFKAKLIPEGMWSPLIENLTVPPKLAKLFDPAYADGARIHTNSWGAAANLGAYDSMAQQADDFLWSNSKMLILFAAGNSGVDADKNGVIDHGSIGSPGTAKNVLTVGASKNYVLTGGIQRQIKDLRNATTSWGAEPISSSKLSENPMGLACFSSRGPTTDGRLKPEIVAPGTNILSVASHVAGADPLWGLYNKDYAFSGGTSMATPLAAGAAAVAREVLVKRFAMNDPSGAMLKAFLMHTAFDLYPGQFGEGGPTQELARRPNSDEGYGRVDLAKVVSLGAGTRLVDEANGVGTNEQLSYNFTISNGQKLLANLVYFDAPGTPSAAKALVNDLDLVLVGADGHEVGPLDRINNSEVIELSNLAAGNYRLLVKGVSVPMGKSGKQPFALIYTVQ